MVALVRSLRTRWRLRLVWMLTGHPRFKPLYLADVVSYDPLKQAEYLADSGYLVAAAVLARATIENRIKRACLISPNWRDAGSARGKFCKYVGFLKLQGLLTPESAAKADRFYCMASEIAHGKRPTVNRCHEVVGAARSLSRTLDHITRECLRCEDVRIASSTAVPVGEDRSRQLAATV